MILWTCLMFCQAGEKESEDRSREARARSGVQRGRRTATGQAQGDATELEPWPRRTETKRCRRRASSSSMFRAIRKRRSHLQNIRRAVSVHRLVVFAHNATRKPAYSMHIVHAHTLHVGSLSTRRKPRPRRQPQHLGGAATLHGMKR